MKTGWSEVGHGADPLFTRVGSHRVRMIEIREDVVCLQLSIVNAVMVGPRLGGDRSWVLIDAGLRYSAKAIRRAAADRFGPGARPAAIILTHGHFDHVGSAAELADEWQTPIYAHELELPYVTGRSSYPPADPTVGGGLMSLISPLYPHGPIDLGTRIRPLRADGSVPGMPGWSWRHTPGHTSGHISLFRESDRLLIAGDAFVTTQQESVWRALVPQPPQVHRPPAYFTSDWQAAHRSVAELAHLQPHIAVTGHGAPLAGDALRSQLSRLVHHWEQRAMPRRGRYIHCPAHAGAHGVIDVPPGMINIRSAFVVTMGLTGLVIFYWYLRRRSAPQY